MYSATEIDDNYWVTCYLTTIGFVKIALLVLKNTSFELKVETPFSYIVYFMKLSFRQQRLQFSTRDIIILTFINQNNINA